jgi:hypothetical protein
MHELARLFMYQFPTLEPMSLDEFLSEYTTVLTDEQNELGLPHLRDVQLYHILK